jgi:hypothetical protein
LKKKDKLPGNVFRGHKLANKRISPNWGIEFAELSYTDVVLPEIIHIAMIHDAYGWADGIPIALRFLELAADLIPATSRPIVSHIGALNSAKQDELIETMKISGIFNQISLALSPLSLCYVGWPITFIPAHQLEMGDAVKNLEICVARHFHRHSVPSGMALASLTSWGIKAGKIHYPSNMKHPDFNLILTEPESEAGKMARTEAWLHVLSQFSYFGDKIDRTWAEKFWIDSAKISECYIAVGCDDENR